MKFPAQILSEIIAEALEKILPRNEWPSQELVVKSQNPKFADYQCNIAMALAKALKKAPRQIAQELVDLLDVSQLAETPEIAGPGFINFRLTNDFINTSLKAMALDDRLGMEKAENPQKVIVDFSSPNLAKEMHVGHLRSTIIGDSIARFNEFEGHDVKRVNHVGDWGTQFGMLIQYIREEQPESLNNPENFAIANLEDFYRNAKKRFDENEEFQTAARKAVVALQSGDAATLAVWEVFCKESLKHCHEIYDMLNISIEDRGESAYNDELAPIVDELKKAGLAVETQGALGVFLDGYETAEGEKMPTIVQKSDGGFIYATTDLAALKYRSQEENADKILYVTDARQRTHFNQVFEIADKMDWIKQDNLKHIGFGMMLGDDGRPFKTRDGGTIRLKDLLLEAETRAGDLARELSPDLNEDELKLVAKAAGWGGVKYSDLLHGIATDYKFSWDKMLARDGNTAFYLLISYARTRSVGRRAGSDCFDLMKEVPFSALEEQELKLAKKILATAEIWEEVVNDLTPNKLLAHLYELARDFSSFWNACPILKIEDEAIRDSRLALCGLTGKVLAWGLSMVGIQTLEKI